MLIATLQTILFGIKKFSYAQKPSSTNLHLCRLKFVEVFPSVAIETDEWFSTDGEKKHCDQQYERKLLCFNIVLIKMIEIL